MKLFNTLCLLMIIPLSCGLEFNDILKENLNGLNASVFSDSACFKDLKTMIQELGTGTWALKILDSSTKIQSGFAIFSDDIGQFDECIQAENKDGSISGKYCLGYVSLPASTPELEEIRSVKARVMQNINALTGNGLSSTLSSAKLTWAACLPRSCGANDFNNLYKSVLQQLISIVEIDFNEDLCYTKYDQSELSTGALLTIIFFCVMICIMLMETFYDLYCRKFEKEPSQFLIAFSVYTNSHKLFKMSTTGNQLDNLNGLKFFSMLWVVLGHTYSEAIKSPLSNYMDLLKWNNQLYTCLVTSATLAVDTFFVVGGCLVSYVYMKTVEREKKMNILIYYLHRYIRLTPPLAALILVVAYLSPYLGDGPRWNLIEDYQSTCLKYGWSNLIYIQNYVSTKVCAGHSWYLAIDMQLYILSPFILLLLRRYTKLTFLFLAAVILVMTGTNFYLAWENEYPALLNNIYVDSSSYLSYFYIKTHTRAGAWVLGLLSGYIIFEIKQNRYKFRPNKILNIFIWACCTALMLFCVFIGHDFLQQPEYSRWGNSLHIAFARNLWSIGICWIILSCSMGYGGPINWFLSLPIYQVLNRFTYSVYLVHFILIGLWYSSTKTPIHFSDLMMGYYFWGHLCFTSIISYFWVLLFESPFIVLEKLLFGSLMGSRKPKAVA